MEVKIGPNWSDAKIAEALEISPATVARVRCAKTSVQEAILPAKASRGRRRRLNGTQEAYLIALVYSAPPEGAARWTLPLLASRLVELGYVETVSLFDSYTFESAHDIIASKLDNSHPS